MSMFVSLVKSIYLSMEVNNGKESKNMEKN